MAISYKSNKVISTILKHDSKVTSYKIALLRAINDVVLAFPGMIALGKDVAVPLRILAQQWVAYYWPFVDADHPIFQGPRAHDPRDGRLRNDMAFRPDITRLRQIWTEENGGGTRPSDGFFLINELRIPRNQLKYSPSLIEAYETAVKSIARTIQMPIQYAGPGQWTVFPRPKRLGQLGDSVVAVPGARPNEKCLVIDQNLWHTFQTLSLWVEALCIHEWCLFTESTRQEAIIERGDVYTLLTDRPDNRRPLSWERNRVDILMMEGGEFICPWTEKTIRRGTSYDLDHIVPLVIYPTNELWNLVSSNPQFNAHQKRARPPKWETLQKAKPHMQQTFGLYIQDDELALALEQDVSVRFPMLDQSVSFTPQLVTEAVIDFVDHIGESRNLARF